LNRVKRFNYGLYANLIFSNRKRRPCAIRLIIFTTLSLRYYSPPLMGGGIKRCFCLTCLTSVCLTSVAYIGPNSRTQRPRKTKIGVEVAHVTRDLDSDTTFKVKRSKVKGQGYQAALVGCTNHYILYMADTIFITRASGCLSIMELGCSVRRTGAGRADSRLAHSLFTSCRSVENPRYPALPCAYRPRRRSST